MSDRGRIAGSAECSRASRGSRRLGGGHWIRGRSRMEREVVEYRWNPS